MIMKFKNLCVALVFVMLAPFQVAADEVTDVVNDVAAKLVQQLPMDKKIALKSLSPDETGLPEDFLRKLTSDLEAALLTASDFEINLATRATMEDVWQEAIEFNNANFDDLYKDANADVMLMMSPRAISTGVEIAITAYALTGDSVGKTLASSGSVLLPIDLQANLGVDVNDLNQQMSQVLAEIEKVGQTGGLISSPNTYAEFYHNARIFQQRGEVDLAMQNYEQAIAEGFLFVDPLLDLLNLANARYGEDGSKIYFEKKIFVNLSEQLKPYAELLLGNDPLTLLPRVLSGELVFPPLLALWVEGTHPKVARFDTISVQKTRAIAAKLVLEEYKSGSYQRFYVDKIRGAADAEKVKKFFGQLMDSNQGLIDYWTISRTTVSFGVSWTDSRKPYIASIDIRDGVDLNKPIVLCGKILDNKDKACHSLPLSMNYASGNAFSFGDGAWLETRTKGMHCVLSVSYTDINGFTVNMPVLVTHDDRDAYRPPDVEKIKKCAGINYRGNR